MYVRFEQNKKGEELKVSDFMQAVIFKEIILKTNGKVCLEEAKLAVENLEKVQNKTKEGKR